MRLHDFIARRREEIIEQWVDFARGVPAAREMNLAMLRDHASEMLDAIIADLQTAQTEGQRALKSLGQLDAHRTVHDDAAGGTASQLHGVGRAQHGFTIGQMVSEYRALRASVLKLWLAEAGAGTTEHTDDLMRFNEAIDQALAESVGSFARVVEAVLLDAQTQLEARVEDRTRELGQVNGELLAQIRERERAEAIRVRLLQQVVRAQEDEQRRLARDLHDQLGQDIVALALKIRVLRNDTNEDPRHWKEELTKLEDAVTRLDEDLDFLVWQLRPTALDDLGLDEAVQDFVNSWSQHSGVSVRFQKIGNAGDRLPTEVETVLYRVTQEALNNVARHAGARHVDIALDRGSDEIVLQISDDGVGFDLQRAPDEGGKHFGLQGMSERAALVGGIVLVESRPGSGTTIRVRIPFERQLP